MSVGRGLFVQPDDGDGTTPVEARRALQGILPAAGVLDGCVVSGKAGEWVYEVAAGHLVTSRGGVDGVVALSIDGATDTPEVDAAPASGSRWDLIWVRQNDPQAADSDSLAVLGVTSGDASGSPSKPYGDVPAGALVLAEAQVAAGATGTAHASVVITQVARHVVTRGSTWPVTSDDDRDALALLVPPTAEAPLTVEHTAGAKAGTIERTTDGSTWLTIGGPSLVASPAAIDGGVTLTANSRVVRDPSGAVTLMVRAARAATFGSNSGVCVLPAGYRPAEALTAPGAGYGTGEAAMFLIGSDGQVGLAVTAGFTQVRLLAPFVAAGF